MPLSRRLMLSTLFSGAALATQPASARVSGKVAPKPPAGRAPFSLLDQQEASIGGSPDLRFFADEAAPFARALGGIDPRAPWLALSGGGENGAFGAGLLNGWTATGTRPAFGLVTGISAGALIAPFAFAGPAWDAALRAAFTQITAADIFELGATPESYFDTWPLARLIARHATPELMAAVAAEHRRGRRLLVLTTNLDAGRPVAWNMGLIAEQGGERALKLFRDVLFASASIPALFPPVYIEAEANGRRVREMHADGGVTTPFFLAPEPLLAAGGPLPVRTAYIVVHNTLRPDFEVTESRTLPILTRALSAAVRAGSRAALATHAAYAQRTQLDLRAAFIDTRFNKAPRGPFDPDYMRALFEHGAAAALEGSAFAPWLGGERMAKLK